jgi:histone H3/H4
MKADEDVKNIKPEAVVMVAKATEMFVELLIEQAYRHAVSDKRKGVSYRVSVGQLCR